jgi:hypothetical protein
VRHYWRAKRPSSGSYLAESVGDAPTSVLRQYIEQQDRPRLTGSRPSAFTTGLKAGALADIKVADFAGHQRGAVSPRRLR